MKVRVEAVLRSCALVAVMAAPAAEAKVGVDETASLSSYNDVEGGFVTTSADGNFKLLVGGRLQPQFNYIAWDTDVDSEDVATFQVRRARLFFLGHVMGEKNRYFIQIGSDTVSPLWSDDTDATDFQLLDAWYKHESSESFGIKVGQFKTPFSRQLLTSSGRLQFADRALATDALGFDSRDLGVEVSGAFNGGRVQYAGAITNGDGPNSLNQDNKMAFWGRLSFNPTGDYGYSEGDYEHRSEMASTLGAAVHYTQDDIVDADVLRFNIDGGIKTNGFALQAEFYSTKVEPDGVDSITTNGVYAQAGYFVKPEKAELVARWSRVMWDGDDNDESEYSFGVNLFCWGHRLKWQAAYSLIQIQDAIENLNNSAFSATGQIWF